jgi:thioredoxin reductase
VAELKPKPFPPGRYPLLVVGSGPGGLQLTYCLNRLGIEHAVLSQDDVPGGMFRRWPVFQRMLSWTKPYTGFDRHSREYERYDWNSLLAEEDVHRGVMPEVMDGTSYFPSRPEMERGLALFAERTALRVRYGCRWETTRKDEEGDFVLGTTDGEYRAPIHIFAVGVAEPFRPPIPGLADVPHYGQLRAVETYADRRVFIVGKQNSGFEIASGLLPWARQIILASPSPAKLSVNTHSLVGVRARYVQPYEDSVLAGGVIILDASIEEVKRSGNGYEVRTRNARENLSLVIEVDDVIAATGFTTPLRDLSELGVRTVGQSGLPVQTPYWESTSVPGIYFAGTINQGSQGMMKHGIPSNSGAVQGYRYNARVLARHIAQTHFGIKPATRQLAADAVVPFLCAQATYGPELWHQRSYLAHVISIDADRGIVDEGISPLATFVDGGGPDGAAIVLESNGHDDLYPVVYVRRGNVVKEHLLPTNPLLDFERGEHRAGMAAALEHLISPSLSKPRS